MSGIGDWFRRLGAGIKAGLQRFMAGRYGTDKLNTALLIAGVVTSLLSAFLPILNLLLTLISYVLLGIVIFRSLSRNTYKRYQENRKYLNLLQQIKDRDHRYFRCPKCRQQVRVPKGKGKIAINCPKCREKFIKKT